MSNLSEIRRQKRAKRQGCSGRCYGFAESCPHVKHCDETWVKESIATIIGAVCFICMVISVPLVVSIAIVTAIIR